MILCNEYTRITTETTPAVDNWCCFSMFFMCFFSCDPSVRRQAPGEGAGEAGGVVGEVAAGLPDEGAAVGP